MVVFFSDSRSMRWRPVAPAGVPHLSTKDEFYRDYLIPKGTLVVGE